MTTFSIIFLKDDNEWKDFEDEKEKDYTGLRIQSLNLKYVVYDCCCCGYFMSIFW